MPGSGDIFLSASEVANNPKTYLVVNAEGRAIEQAILQAADLGLMTVYVQDTLMTNTAIPAFGTVNAVDVTNNKLVKASHGILNGQQITFQTSGTMPIPLQAGQTYYAKVLDSNSFQVCASSLDVVNNVPLVISAQGSGTLQVRLISPAEQYFDAWQGRGDTDLNRPALFQMNIVIAHFVNMGYSISRQENPNIPGIFWWILRW